MVAFRSFAITGNSVSLLRLEIASFLPSNLPCPFRLAKRNILNVLEYWQKGIDENLSGVSIE
jgi:hypothetical protein